MITTTFGAEGGSPAGATARDPRRRCRRRTARGGKGGAAHHETLRVALPVPTVPAPAVRIGALPVPFGARAAAERRRPHTAFEAEQVRRQDDGRWCERRRRRAGGELTLLLHEARGCPGSARWSGSIRPLLSAPGEDPTRCQRAGFFRVAVEVTISLIQWTGRSAWSPGRVWVEVSVSARRGDRLCFLCCSWVSKAAARTSDRSSWISRWRARRGRRASARAGTRRRRARGAGRRSSRASCASTSGPR